MTDLTQTQWMWIIGIALVVLVLGGFYIKGSFGKSGVQFQTGFGMGVPQQSGNPSYVPHGTPVPSRPYCMPCGVKGTVHELALTHKGFAPPYQLDSYTKPYKAHFHDEERWKGKY